jgi:hypothetical protein
MTIIIEIAIALMFVSVVFVVGYETISLLFRGKLSIF